MSNVTHTNAEIKSTRSATPATLTQMSLLPRLSMTTRLRACLYGETACHPRQFALRAAGDVVVGDSVADGVVFVRAGGADEPFGNSDVEFFQRDAVTALPLVF